MSWADKELRKHKVHKEIERAMKDPRFKEERKKEIDEAVLKGFYAFLLITVDYLHRYQGFGKKRISAFLEFADEQFEFVKEDETYFRTLNMELIHDTGVDVLGRVKVDGYRQTGISRKGIHGR